MDAPPRTDEERRCPSCGALVLADAPWCGQCFASLAEPELEPEPIEAAAQGAAEGAGSSAATDRAAKVPTWRCPACEHDNAIELDACAVCGTPFATLMRQGEERPQVDPKDALAWSLIFPGLGHRKVGRGVDGLARGVLFAVLFSMALLTGLSGVSSGTIFGLFAVFMGFSLAVYVGSALEAYRLAEGGEPFVSARVLLWATVGVILLSVVVLALAVVTAARR
jgi:hypothetical protein